MSVALALCGCSDNDKEKAAEYQEATLSLSTEHIDAGVESSRATVTVTSSGDWRLSGTSDWAHPSATAGKSGDEVAFDIDANSTGADRESTFKFFIGSTAVPLQITSAANYYIKPLTDSELSFSKEATTIKVECATNVADTLAVAVDGQDADWLKYQQQTSAFRGKRILTFALTKNEGPSKRKAIVRVSNPSVGDTYPINVVQRAEDKITTDATLYTYGLSAQTISFDVRLNFGCTAYVTEGSDWITNQTLSASPEDANEFYTLTLKYDLAQADASRKGVVHIASSDNSTSVDISLIQLEPGSSLAEIPDATLRSTFQKNGWVLPLEGSMVIVLEAAQKATSLSITSSNLRDLTGIEILPNLTTITLRSVPDMPKLDISALHKVSKLTFSDATGCDEYNLGDNPITSFDAGGQYSYTSMTSLKITGSRIETMDLTLYSTYADYLDQVTSIDVSGCPKLNTLNANRHKRVTTLYLKTGQVIPNLTKNAATSIVYKD
jgi:hypothetical protein